MKLAGRIGIVTGAASGIGRAAALGLAREGADVAVADIDVERASEVVDEIKASGRKAIFVKTDVSKIEETRLLARTTLDEFGKIDILVNNAGGSAREKKALFAESSEEVWDYVIGINLMGTLNCTRAVINHMIERRSGKIVNLGSAAGMIGDPMMVEYSAAKAGVIGFTRALAKEVAGYGINVNCVSPGPTQTSAIIDPNAPWIDHVKESTGLNRLGKPEEIAAMIVFLATDEADFITGQNYPVMGLRNLGGREM